MTKKKPDTRGPHWFYIDDFQTIGYPTLPTGTKRKPQPLWGERDGRRTKWERGLTVIQLPSKSRRSSKTRKSGR